MVLPLMPPNTPGSNGGNGLKKNDEKNAAPIGHLSRIELENFKSYKGKQIIGPFKKFTSIIGPNGSGKSNLMDAISFVLGVQSAQLRGSTLRDLVYAYDVQDSKEKRNASVSLVYVLNTNDEEEEEEEEDESEGRDGDKENSKKKKRQKRGEEEGEKNEVRFSRTISNSGASDYKIDNKTVTFEEYAEKLKQFGILVKARNFLVFQGDIEAVAQKSPKDLTQLFEQLSGSDELKQAYNDAQLKVKEAEEENAVVFGKKKTLMSQRKQIKEQKDEAEKHIKLVNELKELKTDRAMMKLFHLDEGIKTMQEEKLKIVKSRDAHDEKNEANKVELEEKKKTKAQVAKSALVAEKKMSKLREELSKATPKMVKSNESLQRNKKKLQLLQTNLEKTKEDKDSRSQDVTKLEKQLEEVNDAERLYDADQLKKAEKRSKVELSDAQREEFNQKRAEAGSKTFKFKRERDAAENRANVDKGTLERLEGKIAQLEKRKSFLKENEKSQKARLKEVGEKVKLAESDFKAQDAKIKILADEKRSTRAKAEHYQTQIDALTEKLRSAKALRKENEREMKATEAIASMRSLFAGCRGRVTDLIKVSNKKYELAVITALGRSADAVVVDDRESAKECIQYLKDQRVPAMEFIPLKDIKTMSENNERLRELGGTAKLVIDVVSYDNAYHRAMLHSLGDCVVCDTHAEAKKLAYDKSKKNAGALLKVVSLDGTSIDKAGKLTGGSSQGLTDKANRFTRADIDTWRKEKEKLETEMLKLKSVQQIINEESAVYSQKQRHERDLANLKEDYKDVEAKLKRFQDEMTSINDALKPIIPEREATEKSIKEFEAKIVELDAKIHDISDEIYAEFSKRVGIKNIREHEEERETRRKKQAEAKAEFASQRARVVELLDYEKSRDNDSAIKRNEKDIKKCEKEIETLETELEKLNQSTAEMKTQLKELDGELKRAKDDARSVERELQSLKELNAEANDERERFSRLINAKNNHLDALRGSRLDVLKNASMELLEIPRAAQLAAGSGSAKKKKKSSSRKRKTAGDDDEEEGEDEEVENDDDAMDVDAPRSEYDTDENYAVDYSDLKPELRLAIDQAQRDRLDGEMRDECNERAATLEKLEPNMKALEQYDQILEKEKQQAVEIDNAREKLSACQITFREIAETRGARFRGAFEHVEKRISETYRELTKGSAHPTGGQAFLTLENYDEPFLGGVNFTAMPPSKRYREMEMLSGGEKTIAALALLFAIHSYRASPFFVLDEVDAALDKSNVEKMARFVRSKSLGKGGTQSIVISLKDNFYDKAESLVGVSRDQREACSKVLTFDLTQFAETA
ncbi:condensin complex component [Bathycoccus prasinos]|uniref:Structural maintenance of chromosomes protein n=1 Tax=Bathycoccus prasinos TaxID=41875 RepID=K8F3R8_9CHLO|nr:condensin complex component [Bathycoccus prasinos]CCO66720.1 condensin complex component [Bathycoccus prasinos]|eukprot:XP_007511160.1 condensin complex component [Bathycoccus prasinos]